MELADGEAFSQTPVTKRGRASERQLSDADSSKGVLNAASFSRSPESGRSRSATEGDLEMGERRVKQGGGTFFV
jgi:hypothetical protein